MREIALLAALIEGIERDKLFRAFDWQHLEQDGINEAEDRRVRPNAQRQRKHCHGREAGIFQQHAQAKTQVLNHRILPPISLQPERIPKSAEAAAQQIKSCFPIELVPISQQQLAVSQLSFPLLLPIRSQSAWHDHSDYADQP